jgi:CelD/BcsL family acetyltransferase involved in cellulose biosynthesis
LLEAHSLPDLRRLWADLPGGAISTPFQTPEFLHAFQETQCRQGESELAVAAFCSKDREERPFMILPLVRYRRGPLRVAGVPDFGVSDQNAPVVSPEALARSAQLENAIRSMFEALRDVDLVDIRKLHEHIGNVANPLFSFQEGHPESCTLCLDLQGSASTGGWGRKSIYKKSRSKYRRLVEAGVTLVEAASAEERLSVFEDLAAQRAARFGQLGREDSLQRTERTAFYKCLARLDRVDSPLTALSLKRGEETVAAMMVLAAGAQATAVLVSIGDPKWHGYSPGMVLFAKAIEWASARGCRRFSFGTGQQEYKQRFGGDEQPTKRLLLPLNARGRLFVRAREAHRTAQELLQIAVRGNGMTA